MLMGTTMPTPKKSTLTDHRHGTYAALRVLDPSANWLREHCMACGINQKKSELENRLHATLIYSRVPCPSMMANQEFVYVANFAGYELFESDGKKALVVLLSAPDVVARHNELRALHGASHDYKEYTPHVTLSYDFDRDTVQGLPVINFPIILGKEYVEPLED